LQGQKDQHTPNTKLATIRISQTAISSCIPHEESGQFVINDIVVVVVEVHGHTGEAQVEGVPYLLVVDPDSHVLLDQAEDGRTAGAEVVPFLPMVAQEVG